MRNLVLFCVCAILLAPLFPALAGSEFMLAPPTYTSAPDIQTRSSVASDGGGYFVAWTDFRAADGVRRVFGARLSPDGTPLEPAGIILDDRFTGEPRVVFAGGNYFVMWQTGDGTAAKRISPEGGVLDAAELKPLPDFAFFTGAVATNGVDIAVIWRTPKAENHVSVLDSGGVMKSDLVLDIGNSNVQVAWNGSSFVVSSIFFPSNCYPCPSTSAKFFFIDRGGIIAGPVFTPPLLEYGSYNLTALEDRILLVTSTASSYSLWLFDNEGTLVRRIVDFDAASSPTGGRSAAVANDGRAFIVAWVETRTSSHRLLGARVTREGVMQPEPSVITPESWVDDVAIAARSGGDVLVTWTSIEREADVFAQHLNPKLQPDAEAFRVTNGTPAEDQPTIASNASVWLAAWIENRGADGAHVVVMRRARDGAAIDATPLAAATFTANPYNPARGISVASNGTDFLVVWLDEMRLMFRRLSSSGVWLDAEPRLIANDAVDFSADAVAWNGADYFVVWSSDSEGNSPGPLGVAGVPVGSDGSIGTKVQLSPEGTDTSSAKVVSLGRTRLVVWVVMWAGSCHFDPCPGDTDVLAARVSSEGTLLDTAPIQISTKQEPDVPWDGAGDPTLAAGGDVALVTWRAGRELRGARVTSNGQVLDSQGGNGTLLVADVRGLVAAESASDGIDYLLLASSTRDSQYTIVLYRISCSAPLGTLGTGVELSRVPWSVYSATLVPAIDARPNGRVFLAYPRATFASPYNGVSRIFAQTWEASRRTRTIRR